MKLTFLCLLMILSASVASAQQNFWAGMLPTKCNKVATSCLKHLQNGCSTSGVYKINVGGVSTPMYCDQVTAGGGWTLISSVWIPAYDASMDPKIKSLGQTLITSAPHPYSSMRLYCKSTARFIDRYRTAPSATTDINYFSSGNAQGGTETRLNGDSEPVPANWTHNTNQNYLEMHGFFPGARRFIMRTSDPHCADEYSSIGGEINNPRLGQEGRVFIR